MSGGFFRGTSADQDTRFSNKQAKLLKSQKFAPELDHLVDIKKVKMEVVKPWIAKRVTELLGFEDEVLINFIYGLLDGKDVNGKNVQISLTGFMEKNTGKFMKELWALLLSAQNNASGVPQQFLDAKEEETRKKKVESDRIANEIQKKKEKEIRDRGQEKLKKMDGGVDSSKATNAVLEQNSKQMLPRSSSARIEDEQETAERNGLRERSRGSTSPNSADFSPSPTRGRRRSISRSFSHSRSHSAERFKSRNMSHSPQPRGRSISSERVHHSPQRRSIVPHRKDSRRRHCPPGSISPLRRTSSRFWRRSTSRSHRRSPSPIRRRPRSPFRRRSPSPMRRRSPSPLGRRHSPVRHRSPSLVRCRSPRVRRRSPPIRRRSPSLVLRRSPAPIRRISPSSLRHGSPSPTRHRSPSPIRRRRQRSSSTPHSRSLSPMRHRSPIYGRRRSPSPFRHRSPSPYGWSSASPVRHTPPSTVMRKSPKHKKSSLVQSPRQKSQTQEELSPVRRSPFKVKVDPVQMHRGPDSMARQPLISLRSPQRDLKDQRDSHKKVPSLSTSQNNSPSLSDSPHRTRRRSPSEDHWSSSPHESPVKQTREQMNLNSGQSPPRKSREQKHRHDSTVTTEENEKTNSASDRYVKPKSLQKKSIQKDSPVKVHYKEGHSSERLADHRVTNTQGYTDNVELRRKYNETKSEKASERAGVPVVSVQQKSSIVSYNDSSRGKRQYLSASAEGYEADKQAHSHSENAKDSSRHQNSDALKATENFGQKSRSVGSGSDKSDRHKAKVKGKRKHKRSHRKEGMSDDDYSSESEIEDRKVAKRRRDEKRLRKEERHRRREERHRRREERRAEKLKAKSMETNFTAFDSEKGQSNVDASDGERGARRDSRSSNAEETESEQKKLEIELRKKALESLRAKKGISR